MDIRTRPYVRISLLSFGQVLLIKDAQCVFSLFTSSGSSVNMAVNNQVERGFLWTMDPNVVSLTSGSSNCDASVPCKASQLSNESPQIP